MLELGNALGFLIGPLMVPNPPETKVWKNDNSSTLNVSSSSKQIDAMTMREDIMLLMYSRKSLQLLREMKE